MTQYEYKTDKKAKSLINYKTWSPQKVFLLFQLKNKAYESENIKHAIVHDFGKAISVYKGERGALPGSFDIKEDPVGGT